ncbi:hypothetical protein Gotur_028469, partial [Gossypium turneri]
MPWERFVEANKNLYENENVLNLGTYLGVPLLHDRITRSTLS